MTMRGFHGLEGSTLFADATGGAPWVWTIRPSALSMSVLVNCL
jgi:hypothetical protein